jgi:hypothetical protein
MHTIVRKYEDYGDASADYESLREIGLREGDVWLVTGESEPEHMAFVLALAAVGLALGGVSGLLWFVGTSDQAGLLPLLNTGWFLPLVVGVVLGALAGGLFGAIVAPQLQPQLSDAEAADLREGATLLCVRIRADRSFDVGPLLSARRAPKRRQDSSLNGLGFGPAPTWEMREGRSGEKNGRLGKRHRDEA